MNLTNSQPPNKWLFFMVKLVKSSFISLFVIALAACTTSTTCEKAVEQSNDLRVFFTPGTDCEQNIINEINKAQEIDVAVYSISNVRIVDALLKAYQRGTQIRIITDRTQSKGKGSLVSKLKSAGIPVVTNKKHKIEHNKWAIFDQRYVVAGSYNWPENATKFNSESCLFFTPTGEEFSQRFEYLWNMYQ